ncbi:MAG: hypothetical protein KAS95_06810, partial [Candidatus Heimdallarchaeota archaeon]|nr:hypothetical protein [Candidatus Heimdallarchaeota archaeon]
ISAFFIVPKQDIVSWEAFGIVSGIVTLMIISGILLYVKTKNEFHIIPTLSVAIICQTVITFLSPMELPVQLGLVFNLALIGLLVGIVFDIKEFKIIFLVASGLLLIPYLWLTFTMVDESGYWSLLFLATGILILLTTYITYTKRREALAEQQK